MRRVLGALVALALLAAPAMAQTLVQGGATPIVPGHVGTWIYNGILGNGEGSAGCTSTGCNKITDLGITAPGTPFCLYDNPLDSSSGYHQLCIGALTTLGGSTGGFLSYNAYGGAAAEGLFVNLNGVDYPFFGTGTGNVLGPTSPAPTVGDVALWNGTTTLKDGGLAYAHVATNASLQAAATTSYPNGVWRDDFVAGEGAAPLFYQPSGSACSLNSGAGDNGSQVKSADGKCWLAVFADGNPPVLEFGAKCDGTTDDTAAINAAAAVAANAGGGMVLVPNRNCYSATGITIAANVTLEGAAWGDANAAHASGSIISCPNTGTVTCVHVAPPATSAAGLRDITILGVGTPASGSTGLLWELGVNIWSQNVKVENFGTCARWYSYGGSGGLGSENYNFHAAQCLNHYLVFDGWPEAYFFGGRMGDDGTGDFQAQDFVEYTATNTTSGGAGPNTIVFVGTQFNPGNGDGANCAFNWSNAATTGVLGSDKWIGVHLEEHLLTSNPFFCSDATVHEIPSELITSSEFENTANVTNQVFALNAATALHNWYVTNTMFGGVGAITLAPTPASGSSFNRVSFNNIGQVDDWSLTSNGAGGNNFLSVTNSEMFGALTIAGTWDKLSLTGDWVPGTITDTAHGNVSFDEPWQSWTPTMTFGGSSSGWVLSTDQGQYHRTASGGLVAQINLTVGTVGSATGNVSITGLPVSCINGQDAAQPVAIAGLSGTTATWPALAFDGSNPGHIDPLYWSSTNGAILTNANFATVGNHITGSAVCSRTQ